MSIVSSVSLRVMTLAAIALIVVSRGLAQSDNRSQPAQTKNVLIFYIDDLRPELGCYGVDSIRSPSIDTLAAQGLLFNRAYCQQALCAPSRISMMTGLYPDHTGICDLFTPLRKVNETAMTLPRYFKQHGYITASFGKVYHHRRDDATSWSEFADYPTDKYANPQALHAIAKRVEDAKQRNLSVDEVRNAAKGPATEIAEVDDEAYIEGKVAAQAIASLRKNRDNPFCMCIGFAKPHLPFAAPKRFWELYKREQFTVPKRELPDGTSSLAITSWGELRAYHGIPMEGPLSDEVTQELMHGYAAAVSFSDAQVGKVLAELDRLGLRENTIVVLWGDHGYKLGEYGLWCKHTNLELDTRVPLIISAPGYAHGQRTESLVEIVDVFPTVASLATGDVPDSIDGKSLEPLLQDSKLNFRPFAISQYQRGSNMGYSLRNDRYRYTEWIQAGSQRIVATELYDHQDTDTPSENLADKLEYADLASRLSEQLGSAQRIQTTNVKLKTTGK
ncbi:sulfatase [Rubripirellula reticaptiva]|uniref:Choline-sulfatase n=1 Tax=Rubripirellula reticaptiva TaxID=2528013 RepID=A0A5C6ETM3_9BACT|nr:sulfatase [Rubripirellula reticaptiva]TWU51734.1 Choline-sulfatase [Rubripirellula reticaptiva]